MSSNFVITNISFLCMFNLHTSYLLFQKAHRISIMEAATTLSKAQVSAPEERKGPHPTFDQTKRLDRVSLDLLTINDLLLLSQEL